MFTHRKLFSFFWTPPPLLFSDLNWPKEKWSDSFDVYRCTICTEVVSIFLLLSDEDMNVLLQTHHHSWGWHIYLQAPVWLKMCKTTYCAVCTVMIYSQYNSWYFCGNLSLFYCFLFLYFHSRDTVSEFVFRNIGLLFMTLQRNLIML